MKIKPLTAATLPQDVLQNDRTAAVQVDNAAVGEKALYLPGRLFARSRYLPLDRIERAYMRVMLGQRAHGNFRQPLLVLCTGGQEQVFLYKKEETVRTLLNELQKRGIAVGKPKAPKPN
jgi:hypothetical protein